MMNRKIDLWPLYIFAAAFLIRIIYFLSMREHVLFATPQLDSKLYDEWASSIAAGNWLGGTRAYFTSPFYAYILAVVYKLFGHGHGVIRIVQIICGSLVWVITYLIGKELFNRRVGIMAGFLGSFYGYAVFLDAELLKSSIAVFTMTVTIYAAIKARKGQRRSLWFLTGTLCGLTVINVPNALLLLPVLCVWAMDRSRPGGNWILSSVLVIAGAMLMIFPVTVRNFLVEKDFVLVSSNGGMNFYIGNNADADGGLLGGGRLAIDPSKQEDQARQIAEAALGRELRSSEVSAYWFGKGLHFIREKPFPFVKLIGRKFLLFLNGYEIPDNTDYYYIRRLSPVLRLPLFSFFLLAPLGITGLVFALPRGGKHVFSASLIAGYMLSLVLFMVFGRYRILIAPLFCLYAAYSLDTLYGLAMEKRMKRLTAFVLPVLALWFVANLSLLRYPPEYSQKIMGDAFLARGQCREGLAAYQRAKEALPRDPRLRLNYANGLETCGLTDEALREYGEVLVFFPANLEPARVTDLRLTMARLLMQKKDHEGAKSLYRAVLLSDEENGEALNNLAWLSYLDGEIKAAKRYAEHAFALQPSSASVMDTLAMILLREGLQKQAASLLRQAYAFQHDPEIAKHLAQAEKGAPVGMRQQEVR